MIERISIDDKFCVDNVDYVDCQDWVQRRIQTGSQFPEFILSQNILKVVAGQRNGELREVIYNAGLVIPDGMGLVFGMRLLGVELKRRVAGVQLMESLISLSNKLNYRIYFLGAQPGIVEKAVENLKDKYQNLEIAGYHHGYFDRENCDELIESINKTQPDILFIAMGSPLQELFLNKYRNNLNVPVCMGVGGSFDVLAGKVDRAPSILSKFGLEWLHRVIKEPRRMRIVIPGFSRFFVLLLKYRIRLFFDKELVKKTIITKYY